jgi:hypothetical protein
VCGHQWFQICMLSWIFQKGVKIFISPCFKQVMFAVCKFFFYDELTNFLPIIIYHNLPSSWLYFDFDFFFKRISFHMLQKHEWSIQVQSYILI